MSQLKPKEVRVTYSDLIWGSQVVENEMLMPVEMV